jgi:putative sterol carrier protein
MRWPSRRVLLASIFAAMPRQFRRGDAGDLEAVVHWKIRDGRKGSADVYELRIADGRCRTTHRPKREPTVTIEIDPIPFLRLVAGAVNGPELFMTGKLAIGGDMTLAMRLQSLFVIPPSSKS